MRAIKSFAIIVFVLMILTPVAMMNTEPCSISKIDNRALAKFPFGEGAPKGALTMNIESYVQDRIGFREKMILAFAILNDKLFGKMVHPTYCYGKDGYIFLNIEPNVHYGEYHVCFAEMVKQIQTYCEKRNVPFLFAFEPLKNSVLKQYLPRGVNYDNSWIKTFLHTLREKNINYIDNTGFLIQKTLSGEVVFNKKFDAGHWNDWGAFYGVNNILTAMRDQVNTIHVNSMDEFNVTQHLETSLLVSEFPIYEYVPAFAFKYISEENKTNLYSDELERDSQYKSFSYYVNNQRQNQGSPKVLVFQGSYMNGKGNKYLRNSFGEYIAVHNYQNVINFPYYFNIFKPDFVLFEVTEHTLNNGYFDMKRMKSMNLNPPLADVLSNNDEQLVHRALNTSEIKVKEGKMLAKITWTGGPKGGFVWLLLGDEEFDMIRSHDKADTYYVTVPASTYQGALQKLKIVAAESRQIVIYE